jgi:hypothetical protein
MLILKNCTIYLLPSSLDYGNVLDLYPAGISFGSLGWDVDYSEMFHDFFRSLKANVGEVFAKYTTISWFPPHGTKSFHLI